MRRFDRMFGILLLLRDGKPVSAADLARRFNVSRRTIHRDLDALSVAGVPVYTERGRNGGLRLLEGYFLPPLMFSRGEAVALLLGLTLLQALRASPYAAEMDTAKRKLLAAVPDALRTALANAETIIGFEGTPVDIFHPEPPDNRPETPPESETVTTFLQARLDGRMVRLMYQSPYRAQATEAVAQPLGLFWDRDRWYLAGRSGDGKRPWQLWRADRILTIMPSDPVPSAYSPFDIRTLLGRAWLQSAMDSWRERAPVQIRVTDEQATRLRQDWYYRHARFDSAATGAVLVTFGEDDPSAVAALVRWLGPGAQLVAPAAWRDRMRAQLAAMQELHATTPT